MPLKKVIAGEGFVQIPSAGGDAGSSYERPSGDTITTSSAVDTFIQAPDEPTMALGIGIPALVGILKTSDTNGRVTVAVAGTDYLPGGVTNAILKVDSAGNADPAVPNTDYQVGAGTSGVFGTFAISNTLGGSVTFVNGIITVWSPAN